MHLVYVIAEALRVSICFLANIAHVTGRIMNQSLVNIQLCIGFEFLLANVARKRTLIAVRDFFVESKVLIGFKSSATFKNRAF